MKKAFTLIELLVVIAIIAILAAILFPVFAQAKTAAKKTAAISNQKQISLGIMIYMTDYDDLWPRNDDCQPGSALNQELRDAPHDPAGVGCSGAGPYYNRMNHYSWQKWVLPYTKNVQLFEHPGRQKFVDQWNVNGQIMNGFALNTGLTGMLNTHNRPLNAAGRNRSSWIGGRQAALPDVSAAMLLFEFGHENINFTPVIIRTQDNSASNQTIYPNAVREWWARNLMEWTNCTGWNMSEISNDPDPRSTIGGGIVLGMADGSARFYQAQKFLSLTPTYSEYITAGSLFGSNQCGFSSGVSGVADVNIRINYPLWGFTQ